VGHACAAQNSAYACSAATPTIDISNVLNAPDGTLWAITLRFRGVIEEQSYTGGTADGLWYVGGQHLDGNYNIYELDVDEPAQRYFLNAGTAELHSCESIDYSRTIFAAAGATVRLFADSQDGNLISNQDVDGNPVVVPDVPPAPDPYDGQFIQMDVVNIVQVQ